MLRFGFIMCVCALLASTSRAQDLPLMTAKQVLDIVALKPSPQVRVQGVVTGIESSRIMLQDDTDTLVIMPQVNGWQIKPGDVVEFTGSVINERNWRQVIATTMTKRGERALPDGELRTGDELLTGAYSNRRVRVRGRVHEFGNIKGTPKLSLQSGGVTLPVLWTATEAARAMTFPDHLLDAEIEVTGVPIPTWSGRIVASNHLLLATPDDLRILKPGSADPFTMPLITLATITGPQPARAERAHVRGIVTNANEGGWFYFTDGTGTARASRGSRDLTVRGQKLVIPAPGDEVEVVGLCWNLIGGTKMPYLSNAEWRIVGHPGRPGSTARRPTEILKENLDGHFVSVIAKVTGISTRNTTTPEVQQTLFLQADGMDFYAALFKSKPDPVAVAEGNWVKVEGVVTMIGYKDGKPSAFRLTLQDMSDVTLTTEPGPWMSPVFQRWALAALSMLVIASAWIIMLRRTVKAQTAQLERKLEQERELGEMKSRFIFTVSHEFRNPLAVIMSCSDVLQRFNGKLPPEQHTKQIEGIQHNVRRMADLMEDVLLLGRAEAGRIICEPEPTNVRDLCQRLVDQTHSATSNRNPITITCDPNTGLINLDRNLMQHILGNLLTNAVKYSPTGEPIELAVRIDEVSTAFVVTDHGQGIPAADMTHLFDPFHRGANVGDTPGTGLGLAITRRCVTAHGGTIDCESIEGKGTCFIVTIPIKHHQSEP